MTSRTELRLFRFALSGHCHRVELLLSLLGLKCEFIDVDLAGGAQKRPEFLAKNAFGQVPVLEHGSFVLADSNAILLYLAQRFDRERHFWPQSIEDRAAVQRWFSVAAGQLARGPAAARVIKVFGAKLDHAAAVAVAEQLFSVLERELQQRSFLVGSAPTLADIALYSYTAHAPEGGISLDPYPVIRAWLKRIEALPGFVPMPPAPQRRA